MLVPLRRLIEAVRQEDGDATFCFTGDFCDRGPDTRGVVDLLIPMLASGEAKAVRGNHDETFDLVLNGQGYASGPQIGGKVTEALIGDIARMFWNEGLPETLESYEPAFNDTSGELEDWLAAVRAGVPTSHKHFFRNLPAFIDEDDFFVTHASWPPDYPDRADLLLRDPHLRHEALWGRYTAKQIAMQKTWSRPGYCGHTPVDNYLGNPDLIRRPSTVIFGESITLVDTAAFTINGCLSAVCHETREVLQVHHSGELL